MTGARGCRCSSTTALSTHGVRDSRFRGDFLFSYAPMPGTVFFVGYGAGYADTRADPRPYSFPRSLGLRGYGRQDDALFIKASYLLRL